ncbi:MAG TPA: LacI family DNA-binding transcriptional regulator [Sphingobacteriaceae bacterium]
MKKITIHDIAHELNITFSTVARALNDHPAISSATKKAVKETAERLGYRQNKLASSLRSGKTHTIGIIVPSLHVSFFSSVVSGIERVMNDNGYSTLLYQSNESLIQEKKGIETFMKLRVDGIISSITTETLEHSHYLDIKKRNIPLVLFDRIIEGLDAPSVTINDYQGGFLATEHLIKQNYKHILHITAEQDISIFKERLRGYIDALKYYHLPVREELIIKGKSSKEFGSAVITDVLNRNLIFDSVFALDITAIGVIQELNARKISIPDQVGVIGFANESFGELISPRLSTVDQQTVRMGEEAAKLFLKISENEHSNYSYENMVLDPLLIIRESSMRRL